MTRLATSLLAWLCFALAAVPAAAQQRTTDPEAMAAAREMLLATDFFHQMEAATEETSNLMITTIMEQHRADHGSAFPAELEADFRRILGEHNDAVLATLRPNALDDAARTYARYFTAAEIRELHQIQARPVMVKFQRVLPQFMAEVMQPSLAEATRRLPELRQRIEQAVRAWQDDQQRRRPRQG